MAIVYRDAVADDVPVIARLFADSFTDTFAHLYRPEDLDAFLAQFTLEAWQEEMADPAFRFRLAEENGQAAGFCKLGPLFVPVETERRAIELRQLYILPAWKGRGVGGALVEWAVGTARAAGMEEMYLSVYSDNPVARRLYERFGFEEVGSYAFMVGDQADDERIMRLRLA